MSANWAIVQHLVVLLSSTWLLITYMCATLLLFTMVLKISFVMFLSGQSLQSGCTGCVPTVPIFWARITMTSRRLCLSRWRSSTKRVECPNVSLCSKSPVLALGYVSTPGKKKKKVYSCDLDSCQLLILTC